MPSVSKSQQRLMGVAYAVKSGSMELKDVDAEYRDKVASLVDGMTKKDLKKYASTKHDKLPETVDEDFAQAAQNITPSANIGGMGPVVLPSDGVVGSGDVPSVADIDAEDEEEKKKDKTKKKLEMENFNLFTQFGDFLNEKFDQRPGQLVKDLHFETDPEKAQAMKIELGRRQGEVTTKAQIEGGDYSLRRFRKEIRYGDGSYTGVFMPGSYDAATSKLGDGPHKKAVKKVKWNMKKYQQWVDDVASNDGWKHAYDMAQNAKMEPGLLQWAKKEFRGEDPLQRIQWDIEAYAESVKTHESRKLQKELSKVETWVRKSELDYDDWDWDGEELTIFTKDGTEKYSKKDLKDEGVFESIVNEKYVERKDMMKFIEKYMDFVRTSEDFNGSQGGIWVSGENMDEFKGQVIYDYYAEGRGYELGVNVKWEKELNKRGWYSEWYDAGTVQIWPI